MESKRIQELDGQVVLLSGEIEQGDYRLPMLLNNRIPGILPLKRREINAEVQLCVPVTGMTSLPELYASRRISRREMEELLLGLERAADAAAKYLLGSEGFLLLPELIFTEGEVGEARFAYCPFAGESARDGLNCLCRFLLDHIDFDDRGSVELGYALFQESLRESATLESFLRLSARLQGQASAGKAPQGEGAAAGIGMPEGGGRPEAMAGKAEAKPVRPEGKPGEGKEAEWANGRGRGKAHKKAGHRADGTVEMKTGRKKMPGLLDFLLTLVIAVVLFYLLQSLAARFGMVSGEAGFLVLAALALLSLAGAILLCRLLLAKEETLGQEQTSGAGFDKPGN